MSDYVPTTEDIRYEATSSWGDDAIPKNHPARKDAEARFDRWLEQTLLEAKRDAIREARAVIPQYLATAEKWRYDRVMWAFAIMLGEIPEDTPCPDGPADARERAARLAEGSQS